ncbi:branched-chain amino acid ABC transporter ATP-binding protein/permease [Acidiphilium acidophilum]|uniref:branched-chain amino acid ABC transporter ATP-binding protein/permease n=1 Tax=Acidiphilium acidophilum TaxID=76588 RepID=UPI002E8E6629|nr:branched-chain amino acid ABC transporter ATP-binding protein/permease [Acidiphilium acidophilum]
MKRLGLRRLAGLPPRTRQGLFGALLIVLLAFPFLDTGQANIDIAANCCAYAALALGLNIVVGFTGLLDLGYAAFFAIGAYAYGILNSYQLHPPWSAAWQQLAAIGFVTKLGVGAAATVHFIVPFWVMLPVSAVIAAGFGVAFGAPTLRLKGDYLAIVTLGFGEIVPIVARNWTWLTNGAEGLNGVGPPSVLGHSFGIDSTPYYYVGLALVLFLLFVSLRLKPSRIGRAWMAVREDEIAASAMGIHTTRLKLLAFAMGAGFAGMTGTFYIAKLQTATPDMFDLPVSIMVLVMIVLGGLGSVWGAIIGAVLLQLLQAWFLPELSVVVQSLGTALRSPFLSNLQLTSASELIFGIILVTMMLYRRDGLVPATRNEVKLSFAQQDAAVSRGSAPAVARLSAAAAKAAIAGPPAALAVRDLTVRFGGLVALKSVSLDVPAGGVVAVIGPNGSGKSTLFNSITGLVTPSGGSVEFAGQELLGRRPDQILRYGVARTFQNIRLFPNLTVMENVLIGQHSHLAAGPASIVLGLPHVRAEEREAREFVLELLGLFGNRLIPRIDQGVAQLSYANRRRVEIARALAARPRLLMLDEPTAGMNPAESLELAEQIAGFRKLGLTVLLVEHKLDVVTRLADNVVVLDYGEKLAEGPADEVRRNEAVIEAYIGRGTVHA